MDKTLLNTLELFKKTLVAFIDDLLVISPQNGDLTLLRIAIKDQIPINRIMNYCVLRISDLRKIVNVETSAFITSLDDTSEKGLVLRGVGLCEDGLLFCNEKEKDKTARLKNINKIYSFLQRCDLEEKTIIHTWFKKIVGIIEKYSMQEENKIKKE